MYRSQSESHWAAGEVRGLGDLGEGRSTAIGKGVCPGTALGSAIIASLACRKASYSNLVHGDGDSGVLLGGSPYVV
jgi:hypothetical protein